MVKARLFYTFAAVTIQLGQVIGLPHDNGDRQTSPTIKDTWEQNMFRAGIKASELAYLDGHGIEYKHIWDYKYHFDDTEKIINKSKDPIVIRKLTGVKCGHYLGQVTALLERYNGPGQWEEATSWHGQDPGFYSTGGTNGYDLVANSGEAWTALRWRACGEVFTGIQLATSNNKGVACGQYWPSQVEPSGCKSGVIKPGEGRFIVGLYGEGKGGWIATNKGIRGVGIITAPL